MNKHASVCREGGGEGEKGFYDSVCHAGDINAGRSSICWDL